MKYLLALLFTTSVFASEGHQETIEYKVEYKGIATAISASQLNFDWGSYSLQGSAGLGSYGSSQALTFGLGKRFGRVLVNGSIGSESNNDEYSFGFGASFKF